MKATLGGLFVIAFDALDAAARGLYALSCQLDKPGREFDEAEAHQFLSNYPPQAPVPPAGEQPTGAGDPPPGAGAAAPFRPAELDTSALLTAAANQLSIWTYQLDDFVRLEYLAQLIPELRDRAAQFEAHGD